MEEREKKEKLMWLIIRHGQILIGELEEMEGRNTWYISFFLKKIT